LTVQGKLEPAAGGDGSGHALDGYRVDLVFTARVEVKTIDQTDDANTAAERPQEGGREASTPRDSGSETDTGTRLGTALRRLRAVARPAPSEENGTSASPVTSPEAIVATVSTSSDKQGRFSLTLADGVEIVGSSVRLVVSAPSGTTVADKTVETGALRNLVTVPIEPVRTVELEPIDETTLAKPSMRRVAGRIVDLGGKPLPSGLQVVLMARRTGAAADAEPQPVAVARSDRTGVFFVDVPNEEYDEATAVVAGVAETGIPVPVEDGRIAPSVLLPVKVDDSVELVEPDDCGCNGTVPRMATHADIANAPETFTSDYGTCGCINFNKPNRVVEEFEFFSVVRTTEPQLRRLTVGEVERPSVNGNGTSPGGRPADAPLIAAAYDVRIETRELDTPTIQVILVAEDGNHLLIRQYPPADDGFFSSTVRDSGVIGVGAVTDDDQLRAVSTSAKSWTVMENTEGGDAIGLDLRSVRRVTVIGEASDKPWALCGIGISATTVDGRTVPILIEGAEFYEARPWLKIFTQRSEDSPSSRWSASAGVAVATAYAMRTSGPSVELERPPLSRDLRRAWIEAVETMLPASGREILSPDVEVDWDETPTFFQAASVAHGHLLHFKQRWYADGYSLGDLLYSLPLAPGQKKLISVVDWERREQTQRQETTTARDSLDSLVSRDRDLGEVVNGALTESMRGGSRNTTAGIGAGTAGAGSGSYYGMNFGSLVGVSGGYGESNSGAWQVSGKTVAADSMQTLRDKTLQSASSVRSLRTSVVQTVSQGESTRVTTEVVANHNHCHALTIQYFEVLRHLRVAHELADVRECLFVPLPISPFTAPKTLRWRQSLETYLRRPELAPAFDATRRVETAWSEVDYPVGRYADEQLTEISGEIELTILIPLPPLPPRPLPKPEQTADEVAKTLKQATDPTAGFLGVVTAIATLGASVITNEVVKVTENTTKAAIEGSRALAEEMLAETSPQAQYEKFHRDVMPGVAVGFVDQLELYALVRGTEVQIPADFTLVSDYRPAVALLASVRATLPPGITRGQVTQIRVKSSNGLPNGCRVIVNSATFRYRTRLFEHALVEDRRANDDIDLPVVSVSFDTTGIPIVKQVAAGQGAALSTPLDSWEQRDPRTEDRRLTATLVEHLNEHLEFYHHALWWTMDPNRRYMLLDGFEAPRAGGRSIASVVENRLIGIIGNSLVLPVANGVQLDPRLKSSPPPPPNGAGPAPSPLLQLYDTEPLPPASIALPTRGVFAEAVMGECNACEQIDESRFWRWEESPIDEPPAIEPASTATRRAELPALTATPFPTPIVSIQNAPEIPGPAGVAAALDALGKQVFADITGLAGTQANAAAAYSKALDTALAFGKEASALTQQAAALGARDRTLAAIDKAETDKKLTPEEAKRLRTSALEKSIGGDTGRPNTTEVTEKLGTIRKAEADGAIGNPSAQRFAETVLKSYVGDQTAPIADERTAAAKLIGSLPSESIASVETGDPPTKVQTNAGGSQLGGGSATGAGGMPLPLRWLRETAIGALPNTFGSEPTIAEAAAAGTKLTTRRLSGMTVDEFFNTMTDDERKQFYRERLGPYSKQLTESSKAKKVPPQLVAAVILSELVDISFADILQDGDWYFATRGSLGIAQIQVSTAIGEKLFPSIPPDELRDAYEDYSMAIGGPTSLVQSLVYWELMSDAEKRRLAVSRRLRIPQHAIDAAAKLVSLHLQRAATNNANAWPSSFGFSWTGTPLASPQDIYSYIDGADQGAREENLAAMVEGIHNTPSINLAKSIGPDEFGNAQAMATTAQRIAEELYDLKLFH